MAARKERLSFLINFINENGALGKVWPSYAPEIDNFAHVLQISQRARQNLATDAEKLYAAHQLWTKHSENLVCVQELSLSYRSCADIQQLKR